jgi:hypothetical protein
MRQQLEPMRQQLVLEQELLQALELVLELLFCRKRTKQQQRRIRPERGTCSF